jgi:hypothetical protein
MYNRSSLTLNAISAVDTIRVLNLWNLSDQPFSSLARFTQIVELVITFCDITDAFFAYLSQLSLTQLSINECDNLTGNCLSYLASLPLTAFTISGCAKISDLGALTGLSNTLRSLTFDLAHDSTVDLHSFQPLLLMNPPMQLTNLNICFRRVYLPVFDGMTVFVNTIRSLFPLKNLSIECRCFLWLKLR